MRVLLLKKNPNIYTCNVYHVRGNWNAIADVNTLIDCGTDDFILDEIAHLSTGVGKRRVEQIILTHDHFDHSGGLEKIFKVYSPVVYALNKNNSQTTLIEDGIELKIGDRQAIIIHTPGHSNDSICIYVPEEKVLFSGDTLINIKSIGGSYSKEYVDALMKLNKLEIENIYSGHDDPIIGNAKTILSRTLSNVLASNIMS